MTTTAGEISAPVRMPDGFCIGGNWTGFRVLKGSAFLGTRTRRRRNLGRASPERLHMHDPLTGAFIGSVTRRSHDGCEPPPPLKCWSARLVHRAVPPDQPFRFRAEFMGQLYRDFFSGLF